MQVIQSAMAQNATASAVATVAQQTQEEDIIVRGLFQAADPNTVGRLLWYGHLEAYWPWLNQSNMTWHYDFETSPCYEITGTKHCWDAAQILQSTPTNSRTLYTWDPTAKAMLTVPIVPASPAPLNPPWDTTTTNTWQAKLGLAASPTPTDLVNWVRGTEVSTLRSRTDPTTNLEW